MIVSETICSRSTPSMTISRSSPRAAKICWSSSEYRGFSLTLSRVTWSGISVGRMPIDHQLGADGLGPRVGVVQRLADRLLERAEPALGQPAGGDVDLDVEPAQLGLERRVGDRRQHLGVAHRRLAVVVDQVELDLQPGHRPLEVEARLGQHPGQHVQTLAHLLPVPFTVLPGELSSRRPLLPWAYPDPSVRAPIRANAVPSRGAAESAASWPRLTRATALRWRARRVRGETGGSRLGFVPEPELPPRRRSPTHRRVHHGDEFADPYEWLRDKEDADVLGYLEAENDYTEAQTAATSADSSTPSSPRSRPGPRRPT